MISENINNCLIFFNFDSFIRGHHVYQYIWTPVVGERDRCIWEIENKQRKNAIAVAHEEIVVGDIPMVGLKYVNMFPGSYLEAKGNSLTIIVCTIQVKSRTCKICSGKRLQSSKRMVLWKLYLNPNKCHYMCIGKNIESDIFRFENICLENSKEEIILGITNVNKLTFASHIKSICREASQKLSALSKISS